MAVEIPVVVDIMGGIDDSIKQLPNAIKKLQAEVDSYPVETKIRINVEDVKETNGELKQLKEYFQELEDADWQKVGRDLDFTPYINQSIMELRALEKQLEEIQSLRQMEGGGTDFAKELADAHKNIREQAAAVARAMASMEGMQKSFKASGTGINDFINSQYDAVEKRRAQWKALYAELEDYSETYASSINAIRDRVSELEHAWSNMTKAERNAGRDEMLNKYKKEVSELKNEAKTLREILQEQERLANLVKQTTQNRRYEAAVLKMNGDSIRILSEQQRILAERLNKAKFGTDEFVKYKQRLEEVRQKLQQVQGGVNNMTGAMQRQSGVLRNLNGTLSSYVSIFGLLRFAKQLRDITGELEYQRVALGNLIRDEEYGAKLFERIKAAAIESPFRITQLVTYTKQLAAYRIEQENLFDVSKRLADVSAGLGVDMNRLILAYGQVRAASVLRGQELRQFTEAGIPIVELLAEKFTELNGKMTSTADVFRLISERAVPFSMISEIFEDLTEKGGMFYQMQEKQAKTLKGRWEKLKDAFDIAIQTAGETKTFEWQNKFLLNILTFLAKNIRIVPKLIEAMGAAWVTYSVATALANRRNKEVAASSVTVMTTEQFKAAKIKQMSVSMLGAARATKMYTRANAALAASNGFLSRSFAKLQLFMLTNPIGAIATAVAGLASLFVFWRKKTDETTTALDDMDAAIEKINKSTKDYERGGKLIEQYEKLASKTERTTEENNKLHRVMSRLSDLYPELTEQIYDENRSLKDNVDLLKERRKALLAKSKAEAAEELVSARQELAKRDQAVDKARKKQIEAQKEAASWGESEYNKLLKSQQKQADKARAKAEAAATAVVEAEKEREKVAKRIETLERYIDPAAVKPFETAWQNTLARMKDVEVEGTKINLFSDEDIRGYESIYKALQKIDKEYINSNESLKEMKASLSEVSDEYRDQALEEIKIEEARRNGYKAILDVFGYKSSSEKKNKASDLTILKEELKTVQDIYKKYKEFAEYMGSTAAAKKIKEIYGSVTAIDFLNPEDYKKRIKSILQELRKLQGRLQSSAAELSTEAFSDLKETIKKNEGFVEIAKKLPGEPRPTVGYGFYGTLPDGRKVSEGMRMTREEAEKLLDLGIEKRLKYVNNMIAKYGNGLVFNEKQMNVLLDLAWQSGNGVGRVLEAAEGDASKIVELLKTAATSSLITKDPDIIAGVKKRDMRRSKAFELAMSEASEDADAIAQAIGDTEKLVQDVDWEEAKEALEKKLQKLSDDIKRSEVARDFYKNILDLTGDEDLAATLSVSVYGSVGKDFKDRMQEELYRALTEIEPENIDSGLLSQLIGDVNTLDVDDIVANLDKLPEKVKTIFEKALEAYNKYNAGIATSYVKLLMKYDELQQQEVNIKNKSAQEEKEIEDGLQQELKALREKGASDEAIQAAKDRAELAQDARRRDAEIQLSKLKDDYRLFFNSVGVISLKSARDVAQKQKQMLTDQFVRGQISLSKYKRELKEVNEQLKKYTSTDKIEAVLSGEWRKALSGYITEMSDGLLSLSSVIKTSGGIWEPDDDAKSFLDKVNKVLNLGNFAAIFSGDKMKDVLKEANEKAGKAYQAAIERGASKRVANREATAAAREVLAQFSQNIESAVDSLAGIANVLVALLAALERVGNAGSALIDNLDRHGLSIGDDYLGTFFDSMGNFFGGILSLAKLDLSGAWDKYVNLFSDARDYNTIIKRQSDLIEDLDYQYGRLEKSIQKAFGSDYITDYNQQIEALYAKQAAYEAQAEAERAKDKAKDPEKIKEYENNARNAADQIQDMQSQLSEFFSGTDLTSAAKDFANAWIEAYKEYGSVTTAMKEKFQDMVQSMVENSLAARVMQDFLRPIFDEIDRLSQEGSELSTTDIAAIAEMANAVIPNINDAMTTLMNTLTAGGYNIRQQAGQFTGIKRDIANASEESINGLTQATNVNNFYMQSIAQSVAQILAIMSGGTTEQPNAGTQALFNNELALQYMSALPNIDMNMAELLRCVKSVISDKNFETNASVIAVRA